LEKIFCKNIFKNHSICPCLHESIRQVLAATLSPLFPQFKRFKSADDVAKNATARPACATGGGGGAVPKTSFRNGFYESPFRPKKFWAKFFY
jgi:hypothetical protein